MPKELNVSPNERIDFEDFEYGTRTFTVDSLRAHVTRLLSGGYRGGFVFEGFRVALPDSLTNLEVTVYNGIAVDRGGRLITREEGDFFLNNPMAGGTIDLLDGAAKNYIMLEYTFDSSTTELRSFWDPTFANAAIKDSSGDDVPQPKGKEFELEIPTRRAQSWTWIVSSTGFEDTTDANKIRIPVAIIPVISVFGSPTIDIDAIYTDYASTSIIEKPKSRTAAGVNIDVHYIRCADTRIFDDVGKIKVYRRDGTVRKWTLAGGATVEEISYFQNDRENNILTLPTGVQVRSGTDALGVPYEEAEITDIVKQVVTGDGSTAAKKLLKEASKYDCRPMFFAVTEQDGSREEDTDNWPIAINGERRTDSRQFKYWSGLSLVGHPNQTVQSTDYPAVSTGQQKTVTSPPSRIETRIKQQQDFFRVVASLIEEMKYGYAHPVTGKWTQNPVTPTSGRLLALGLSDTSGKKYIIDNDASFTSEYVNANIVILSGPNAGQRGVITKVYSHDVCAIEGVGGVAFAAAFSSGDDYRVELNYPNSLHKYVDAIDIGSLNEVYRARIDQFTDTYAEDLNFRLTKNKVATITVGDGLNTTGDFTGNYGLAAAVKLAFNSKRGAVIYVRAGDYVIPSSPNPLYIGPDTVIVGDGPGVTNISIPSGVASFNGFLIRDYDDYWDDPTDPTKISTASNITFKNLSFVGVDTPFLSNAPLEQQSSPGVAGAGAWRTSWVVGDVGPTYVRDLTLDNVHMQGGDIDAWATDADCSYAVYLVSDETYNLTTGNKGITFKDCKFTSKGGAVLLKSCKDVKITDCLFDSTTSTAAEKTLEGITISSRGVDDINDIASFFGNTSTDGNVHISGCTFTGDMYSETTGATYPGDNKRGWINFTPSYTGLNNIISNCQFEGTLKGDGTALGSLYGRQYYGEPQKGSCIVKCCGPDVLVTGCSFGTYEIGVITQNGTTEVVSSRFYQVQKSIIIDQQNGSAAANNTWNFAVFGGLTAPAVKDYNYWSMAFVHSGIAAGNLWEYFDYKTIIKDCIFKGIQTGFNLSKIDFYKGCIAVHPAASAVMPTARADQSALYQYIRPIRTVSISGCSFDEVDGVLSLDNLKPLGAQNVINTGVKFIGNMWDEISITNCEINGSRLSVCDNSSLAWHPIGTSANGTLVSYSNRQNIIKNFNYSGNKHYKCQEFWGSDSHRGFVATAANRIIFKDNIFNSLSPYAGGTSSNSDLNPITTCSIGGGGLIFSGNEFTNCVTGADDRQITMLNVEILSTTTSSTSATGGASDTYEGTKLKISYNKWVNNFLRDSASSMGSGRVANGIIVQAAYTDIIPALNPDTTNGILHTKRQEHFWPSLSLKDNDLHLLNGNFGFLSLQHSETITTGAGWVAGTWNGYANLWAWNDVVVSGNEIHLDVFDNSLNFTYGNNYYNELLVKAYATGGISVGNTNAADVLAQNGLAAGNGSAKYSFLGASMTASFPQYVACVDLRRMARENEVQGLENESTCVITNNTFRFSSEVVWSIFDSDIDNIIGVRVSKFPQISKISNNRFQGVPLIYKWSWNCPYFTTNQVNKHTSDPNIGYEINISDNQFSPSGLNFKAVDINPATGYGHELGSGIASGTTDGYPSPDRKQWAVTTFNNNIIENKVSSVVSPINYPYRGIVRFWYPHRGSWCADYATHASAPFNADPNKNWLWPYDTIGAPAGDNAGGFGWSQNYASAVVSCLGNTLTNSYFILTWDEEAGNVTPAGNNNIQFELARPHANAITNTVGGGAAGVIVNIFHWLYFANNTLINNTTTQTSAGAGSMKESSLLGHTDGGAGSPPHCFSDGASGDVPASDQTYGLVTMSVLVMGNPGAVGNSVGLPGAKTARVTELYGSLIGKP